MSESESFPSQPQSGTSNHSQTSPASPAGMDWLLALSRMSHTKADRRAAQTIICRLAEAEYRVNELRRNAR